MLFVARNAHHPDIERGFGGSFQVENEILSPKLAP